MGIINVIQKAISGIPFCLEIGKWETLPHGQYGTMYFTCKIIYIFYMLEYEEYIAHKALFSIVQFQKLFF